MCEQGCNRQVHLGIMLKLQIQEDFQLHMYASDIDASELAVGHVAADLATADSPAFMDVFCAWSMWIMIY